MKDFISYVKYVLLIVQVRYMLSLVVMLISRGRKELRLLMLAFLNVCSGVICQHEGHVVVLFHHGSMKRTGYHVGGRVFVQSYHVRLRSSG